MWSDFPRKADVHETLINASKVHSKGHVAVVGSNGGYIMPYNSALARNAQLDQTEIVNEPDAMRLYLENAPPSDTPKIQQHVHTRSDQELCSVQAKQLSVVFGILRREWGLSGALLRNFQRQSCKVVRNLVLLER